VRVFHYHRRAQVVVSGMVVAMMRIRCLAVVVEVKVIFHYQGGD
jgi:hypothetical protein